MEEKTAAHMPDRKTVAGFYVKSKPYLNRGWDNEPAGKEYFDELMRVSKIKLYGAVTILIIRCQAGALSGISVMTVRTSQGRK